MKATRSVVSHRIAQCAAMRIAGGTFEDLAVYVREKDPETGRPWKVSDRQLWRYIALADDLIAKRVEPDRAKRFNLAIAQREALYARAFEAGDWRAALSILKDRDELLGLYPSSVQDLAREVEQLKQQIQEYRYGHRQASATSGKPESNGQRNTPGRKQPATDAE